MSATATSGGGRSSRGGSRYATLAGYALRYWRGWTAIILITLLSSASGVLQPWPVKIVLDYILGSGGNPAWLTRITHFLPSAGTSFGLVAWVGIAWLAIYAIDSVLDIALTMLWIRVGQRSVYDLACDLFARVQRRSLIFHTRHPVGDSLSRVTGDTWCVYNAAAGIVFTPAKALITAAAMIWVMAKVNVPLMWVSLAVAPLLAVSARVFGAHLKRTKTAEREIESSIEAHVQQTLSGIPVVQAFAQEEREHRRFREFTGRAVQAQRRSVVVGGLSRLADGMITASGSALVLALGARQVLAGSMTVGDLVVFLAYVENLHRQFNALADTYTSLKGVTASVDRVMDIMEAEPEVAESPAPSSLPAGRTGLGVRLENVTFGYEPGRPVLQGLTLEVNPGETVAIVGSTGAGKSTLVGLVPRLFDPWSGRVAVGGVDVRELRLRELRESVSIVLQEPFLFPVSVAENIAFGRPGASREEIEAAARAAGAHDFITRLDDGYDTLLGEHGTSLSGGERQRLSIARALLKDAPILILDEPTSALDARTEAALLEALERLRRGRTTLTIAHRLSTIRDADRIVVLEHGRIAEVGPHDELVRRGQIYASLWRTQCGQPIPSLLAEAPH